MSHLDVRTPRPPCRLLRIQEVAADVGLTTRTIRYYEELGLLKPAARSEGSYRLYDADDLERLRFIKGLRDDAGFSLAEIGQLLEDEAARARNRERFRSTSDPAERRAILDDALARVDRQVATLRAEDRPARGDDRRGRGPPRPPRDPPRRDRRRASSPRRTPTARPRPRRPMTVAPGRRSTAPAPSATATTGCSSPASSISLIGTWMQQVAQAWLVLQLTHDPLWLGLVSVAQFGPVIIFGLFGGVIADQLPKRKTLLATQTVAMVLAFVLFGLTATGVVQVWHVMVLAVLLGITNASTCRPASRSRSRWSAARTSRTRSGSTRRMFNASRDPRPGGRRPADRRVRHLDRVPDQRDQLPRGDRRLPRDARRRAPADARDRPADDRPRRLREPRRGRPLRPQHAARAARGHRRRARRDVRDELPGPHPAVRRQRPPCRRVRLRLPHGGVRPRLDVAALSSRSSGRSRRCRSSSARSRSALARSCSPLSTSFALSLLRDVHRRGGRHRHGRDGEHDDPAVGAGPPSGPGDERLHDGLRGLRAGGRPADGLDRLVVGRAGCR